MSGARERYTFRGNLAGTRHGWLRLTPAYSVRLVGELVAGEPVQRVLDPFCGTGTTALACAERGIACDTTDINPFLVWLARAKTARYSAAHRASATRLGARVARAIEERDGPTRVPAMHQIEKWWPAAVLAALGRAAHVVERSRAPEPARDLARLALCRTLIASAAVSFGHQSMSFARRATVTRASEVGATWSAALGSLVSSAASELSGQARVHLCDARELGTALDAEAYDAVFTSPPYPNRMSYVRELRPYMYWLGYLTDAREAGQLDWRAIGGTWGVATSNLTRWQPEPGSEVPWRGFATLCERIGQTSPLLARYVEKYFHDAARHVGSLAPLVRTGGSAHYVVGNSKFYEQLVPVEQIYAALLRHQGFDHVRVVTLRKRTSKKELFEFLVSGRRAPARSGRTRRAAAP